MKGAENPATPKLTPDEKAEKRAAQIARREALQQRRRKALELRKAGVTYNGIGQTLGISETQARKDVEQAIKSITREPAEQVLALELERLDRLFYEAFRYATHSVIRHTDENDNKFDIKLDTDQQMRAIDRAVKLMDRRAKYLGLEQAPRNDAMTQVLGEMAKAFALIEESDDG